MASTGQTLNDRLNAARYALAGQGLARVVCKATTEEVIGPKKKHLDYLLQCTHEPNVSVPQLANLFIERTGHTSWVVVFKALISVHHLMCYGNERFTQYLASSNCNFQLTNFLDKTGVKGYDMSTFIRRYSRYINEKALSYRTVAFDFAKIKRGKEEGSLRTMPTEKLLKTIPTLQNQIDALLEFDSTANDLGNGVINACFMLLFRDLIRLFACYNDGIINLLEKYFDMNKKQARDALEIYKKFLIRMDRVAEFLKTAENVGIDKGEIPDLTRAPSSLLDALEQHLASLEGNKTGKPAKGAKENQPPGASASNGDVNGCKDEEKVLQKALDEEAAAMNQLKERHVQEQGKKPYNPFMQSPADSRPESKSTNDILDLFGDSGGVTSPGQKSIDDLMTLAGNSSSLNSAAAAAAAAAAASNPFADILSGLSNIPTTGQNHAQGGGTSGGPFNNFTNGSAGSGQPANAFDANFSAAFGGAPATSAAAAEPEQAAAHSGHAALPPVPPPPAHVEETSEPVEAPTITYDPSPEPPSESLNVPYGDQGGNRSASPSPTPEMMMRGDGTTPILPTPPEPAFGEEKVDDDDESDDRSGGHPVPPPTSENSPFGAPFDPPALGVLLSKSSKSAEQEAPTEATARPRRPPVPTQPAEATPGADLWGFDNTFAEGGEGAPGVGGAPPLPPPPTLNAPQSASPAHAGGNAPPPSPFSGYDLTSMNQQQIAYMQQMALKQQQLQQMQVQQQLQNQPPPEKKKSAFEDLDFAMRLQMPKKAKDGDTLDHGQQMAAAAGAGQFPPGMMVQGMGGPGYGQPPGAPVAGSGSGFDAFGDILQPQKQGSGAAPAAAPPQVTPGNAPVSSAPGAGGIIRGDLDSSLASLAQNLDINGPKGAGFKKPGQQQFGSPKNAVKTGGATWAASGQGVPGQVPMGWAGGAPAPGVGAPGGQWGNNPMMPGAAPQAPGGMQQAYGVRPMGAPMGGAPVMATGPMWDGAAGAPEADSN